MTQHNISAGIRRAMERAGCKTGRELAKWSGLHENTIQGALRGKPITTTTLGKISGALDCSIVALLQGATDEQGGPDNAA